MNDRGTEDLVAASEQIFASMLHKALIDWYNSIYITLITGSFLGEGLGIRREKDIYFAFPRCARQS